MKRKVTISDVAKACGVAASTVSNALSGRKFVGENTKATILETADRMGYRASLVAKGLRMKQTWAIAFMVGDITNPFFPEVVRGAEDTILAAGYQLILINTDHDPDKQMQAIRHLQERQIDGLILASQTRWRDGDEKVINSDLPVVMINQDYPGLVADIVRTDNERGMFEVCMHLWERGHRHIGFVRGPAGSPAANDRFAGFVVAMRSLGFSYDQLLVANGNHTVASGDMAARLLLQNYPDITAIVAGNDLMAIGVLEAVEQRGLSVPTDISVVGNDDIFVSGFARINLTTLRQPKRDLGVRSADLLLERIGSVSKERKLIKVAPSLVVRGTTSIVKI